jgi:hypothetical protein
VTTRASEGRTRRRTGRTAAKAEKEQTVPALSPDQLAELLRLIKGADTVELKLTVPDANRRSVVTALGMDPLNAQIRQVVFFDTPDLRLSQHGVVVRARRIQGKLGDSVVKLRPVDPHQLKPAQRRAPGFGVEVDALPGGFVCSGSMAAAVPDPKLIDVMAGRKSARRLFNKDQRALFAANAPDNLQLDDLAILGPVNVFKLKFSPADFNRRLVAELWFYPDGSRILELSTKCTPADAFNAAAESKAYLAAHGVDLGAPQQTKTRTALEFFAKELAAEDGPE